MSEISVERARTRLLRRAARRVISIQLATPRSIAHWFHVDDERALGILEDLESAGVIRRPKVGVSWEVLHAADMQGVGDLVDQLIPKPEPPPAMTSSAAAELLRGYAPGGRSLEQALEYAERQATERDQADRVRTAARTLGLRP